MSALHAYHSRVPLRNVRGKPFVTVSAKGISNGLSDTYNDGADFGPDTMLGATAPDQYGPPYTQTTGIQEALNYAAQIGAPVELGPGTFYVSETIWLPNMSGLYLRGAGKHLTTIAQASGFVGSVIAWADSSAANQFYYLGHFRVAGAAPWLVDLSQSEIGAFGLLEHIRISFGSGGGLNLDGNDLTMLLNFDTNAGDTATQTDLHWYIPNNSGLIVGGHFSASIYLQAIEFSIYGSEFYNHGSVIYLNPVSGKNAIYNFFGGKWYYPPQFNIPTVSGTTNTVYLNFIGCMINTAGAGLPNPFFNNPNSSSGSVSVYAKFINSSLQSSSAASLFGSGIVGYAEFDDLTQPLTNVNVNNAAVSTPAVPASGTAQQNTNPFPVTVYLSGGSATEVQVTKYGNTYTVWSSSSATAIPFMSVRLNPGDSITITYSTAPSWTWTPA
ncbi:MAG: hypothetical protein RXR82_08465 [Nitrososphaeria archaeon]